MRLNYFQPFKDSGNIPQASISEGIRWYLHELVQTTEEMTVHSSEEFWVVFVLPEEHINSGEPILCNGVEVLYVLLRDSKMLVRVQSVFLSPTILQKNQLVESSYAHDVFPIFVC
jgi:hypothetical protein